MKSCYAEKQDADDNLDLKKNLVDRLDSKVVPDDKKVRVMVVEKMNSDGITKLDLQKKGSGSKRQSVGMKQGKKGEEKKKLENLAEVPEEVRRKKLAVKEDIWIRDEHGVYILIPF